MLSSPRLTLEALGFNKSSRAKAFKLVFDRASDYKLEVRS
jgi:hypothetical protein